MAERSSARPLRLPALEQQEAHHTARCSLPVFQQLLKHTCRRAAINCAQGQRMCTASSEKTQGAAAWCFVHSTPQPHAGRVRERLNQFGATPQCAAAQQIDVESVSRDAKMHDEGSFHSITTAEGHSGSRSQIAAAVPRGQKAASRSPAIPLKAEAKPTAAPCMRASPPQPLSWHLAPARHEG